jgi:hypothetical protein
MNSHAASMVLEALGQSGSCDAIVGGKSMWPFIRDGDRVRIQRSDHPPTLGSVAAFFNAEQLIVHRVVWTMRRPDSSRDIWLWGDSSPLSLSKKNSTRIAGVIAGTLHHGRLHRFWFTTPARLMCLPLGVGLQLLVLVKRLLRPHTHQLRR